MIPFNVPNPYLKPSSLNPSGQIQLPTGLSTDPLVQSGSSVTPTLVIVTVAALTIVGTLAYYLTRAPLVANEETAARARYRNSAYRSKRR